MTPVNVSNDYQMDAHIDFSTPIRSLGLKINTNIKEGFNRGINIINGIENTTTNFSHMITFSVDNRKKDKWDVISGATVKVTNAYYSVQESLNNKYFDFSWFTEIGFSPNDSWSFQLSADITNYIDRSFGASVKVPLVGAEIRYYFLKNNRGALILEGYDLLNQNTGIIRSSDMNYHMEQQTNSIGRYVMLSFKYRLNKFANNDEGIEIKTGRN